MVWMVVTMEKFKNICLGVIYGLWDSIRGMTLVLHIDAEIHQMNVEKEFERQQRLLERQRRLRRSPSPIPSSASAMARDEKRHNSMKGSHDNPDERSIESLRRKNAPEENVPQGEKKIAKQVFRCCLLNGGFTWLSIIIFEKLILPTIKFVLFFCYGDQSNELNFIWGWLQSILSIIFGMMWVLPIFLLSKIVSSLWFADIANAAYRIRKGRPQLIPSISKLVADFLFSLMVQALFLVQSMLVNQLPLRYVGETLCFIHLCLLYSLYSFEYKWFNMGWELHRRLSYIENNWPYFLGFGVPLTILTNMSNSIIVSSCIFSIFFPLFILSGNEAKPIIGTTETPLRLFSPVIFVSNLLFSRSKSGKGQNITATKAAQYQQQQQLLLQQQQQPIIMKQQQTSPDSKSHNKYDEDDQQRQSPFRYKQPPVQRISPLRSAHKSNTPSPVRSPMEHAHLISGMRPLIPTPATPQATTSSTSLLHR